MKKTENAVIFFFFFNFRHKYFCRDRYKLMYCPNVKEGLGENCGFFLIFFLFVLFSNHRALFETFLLKTFRAYYFAFILKSIFAFYCLLSIIILQHIPCCPLSNLNGVAVCCLWLLSIRPGLFFLLFTFSNKHLYVVFFFLFLSMLFIFLQILTYGCIWLWANRIENFWSINSLSLICTSLPVHFWAPISCGAECWIMPNETRIFWLNLILRLA